MWFWRNCINAGKVLFETALIVALFGLVARIALIFGKNTNTP